MRGFGKAELLGSGGSKDIYDSLESKNSVVQEFRLSNKVTPEQVKGRFYLTKILHALLPKNIPQIEASAQNLQTGKEVFVTEKRYRDKAHISYNHKYHTPFTVDNEDEILSKGRVLKVTNDPRYKSLLNFLRTFGVDHDPSEVNYSYDSEDIENPETNIQLLDNDFIPWVIDKKDKSIILACNFPELKKAIENIQDESVRISAKQSIDRLTELLKAQLSQLPDYEIVIERYLPEDINI